MNEKNMLRFISEIGVNHLGSEETALRYCKILSKTQTDAISFQIRERDFYDGSALWKNELSPKFAARGISCINIAPGPMDTDRFNELSADPIAAGKGFPMKRVGRPQEIGDFVSSVIKHDIKYLSGATINFDGAISKGIF
jgi:hypothetical protein